MYLNSRGLFQLDQWARHFSPRSWAKAHFFCNTGPSVRIHASHSTIPRQNRCSGQAPSVWSCSSSSLPVWRLVSGSSLPMQRRTQQGGRARSLSLSTVLHWQRIQRPVRRTGPGTCRQLHRTLWASGRCRQRQQLRAFGSVRKKTVEAPDRDALFWDPGVPAPQCPSMSLSRPFRQLPLARSERCEAGSRPIKAWPVERPRA